jgi:hypothetical protein
MSDLKITSITVEKEGINILVGDDYDYFIPKIEAGAVINENISDWVHQIMLKKWSDTNSLYKLGSILSSFPDTSKIDWQDTFFMVEKGDFIEEELSRRVMAQPSFIAEGEAPPDSFDSILYRIKLGQELSTDENHDRIKAIVTEKLNQFGFKLI